jgi:hypothetical protein
MRAGRVALLGAVVLLVAGLGRPSHAQGEPWKVLVAIYQNTAVDCDAPGTAPVVHVTGSSTLSAADMRALTDNADDFAALVEDWSDGRRFVSLHVFESTVPITCVTATGLGNSYWPLWNQLPGLDTALEAEAYDHVLVYWNPGPIGTAGYAGATYPTPVSYAGRTFAYSLFLTNQLLPPAAPEHPGEGPLHEWLHGAGEFYMLNGYAVPNADQAVQYGYHADTGGSFELFYRDALRGKLVDSNATPNLQTGISDSVWAFGRERADTQSFPPPPQLRAPLDDACAGTTPTLQWNPVLTPSPSYTVSVYDELDPGVTVATHSTSAFSWTVPSGTLTAGHHYEWRVQSFQAAIGSIPGDLLRFTASGAALTPTIAPNGGPLPSTGANVHVAKSSPVGEIHYTLTGSDPTVTSLLLPASGDVFVQPGQTLKARTLRVNGCTDSAVASAAFTSAPPLVVTKTNDDGSTGTLRWAIGQANSAAGEDEIDFAIPGAGVHTLQPTSPLPALTGPVIINGGTQPGYAGVPLIELNGASGGGSNGLTLLGGDSIVLGLVINGWSGHGIELGGLGGDTVRGCRIGTNAAGTAAVPNQGAGIYANGVGDNGIGGSDSTDGNLISGNGHRGVELYGPGGDTYVTGNLIGTNLAGSAAIANVLGGVGVFDSAQNLIGGTAPAGRNLISGNGSGAPDSGDGVAIAGAGSSGNLVTGNYIGTNLAGSSALPNTRNGVIVSVSTTGTVAASGNTIGGTAAGARNVISGNQANGVAIVGQGGGGTGNVVQGNYIGTDALGNVDLGNGTSGVTITRGLPGEPTPSGNTIGGATPAARNVISGNNVDGVTIVGQSTSGNLVQGNFIGTDATGIFDLGNSRSGVRLTTSSPALPDTASNNTIGGASAGAGNVISGNDASGVAVIGNATGGSGNKIVGNLIGLSADRSVALGNGIDGVVISTVAFSGVATGNTVGGASGAEGNVIGGNSGAGVKLEGNGTTANTVEGNSIGVTETGSAVPNGTGVQVTAPSNTVTDNAIQGNTANGVTISSATGDRVLANAIDANGGLGIDLVSANNAQAAPVVSQAWSSTATYVAGTLTAAPSTVYRIDLFGSPSCDGSGAGEGRTPLANLSLQTAANGVAALQTVVTALPLGSVVTATATDPVGNTSEFSLCRSVAAPPPNDSDGDGFPNTGDNCPMLPNPTQADTGRIGGTPGDGIGDACQCGDVSQDGAVTQADVTLFRQHLASPGGVPFLGAAAGKCSVIGVITGQCDLLDAVVLRRALAGLAPGVTQVCGSASGS